METLMIASVGDSADSALSWATRISRTRLSTVDGLAFSESSETASVHSLEGILQTVQKLKIKRCLHEELEEIQKVGQGETFLVTECKIDGTSVAVKHIRLESSKEDGHRREVKRRLQSVLREILIMHHGPLASHPNILTLLGYGWKMRTSTPLPYIVVEYGAGGSLRCYLTSRPGVALKAKMILGGDVASGLMALHQCGIVHGDVKLDNVVIFHSWDRPSGTIAKICDFGHSILLAAEDKREQKYYGTTLYNAPEVSRQKHTPIERALLHKCDVWAYGLLVWELLADGAIYFKKSWRHDPAFARSTADSFPALSRTDTHESRVANVGTAEDSIQPEEEGVLGTFDTQHLRNLAKAFVNNMQCSGSSFEKSYLRPLFDRTLQEDPAARLSDLARLPIVGIWNSVGTTSLQSKLAMHVGTSEFKFDMFRLDLGREILWEHQQQMLRDFERVADGQQVGDQASSAAFQTALCYIMGFGSPPDHSKASQYLRKASEAAHPMSRLFNQPLLSVLTRLPTTQPTGYTDLIVSGLRAFRTFSHSAKITLHVVTSSSSQYPRVLEHYNNGGYPDSFCNFSAFKTWAERLVRSTDADISSYRVTVAGGSPKMTLLEIAIAFEDAGLVANLVTKSQVSAIGAWGETALIQACRLGKYHMLQLLLAAGANPSLATKDGCTVFHWLFCLGADAKLITSSSFASLSATQILLDQPCSAVHVLHPQWPLQLSGTPLAFAVSTGCQAAVDALLACGANPRAPAFIHGDEQGGPSKWTPIHLAVKYHFTEILAVLLKADFDNQRNRDLRLLRYVVLPKAAAAARETYKKTALKFPLLQLPCALSHLTTVERYGIHGKEYQKRIAETIQYLPMQSLEWMSSDGRTPLMQAIDLDDFEVVSLLLSRRPDLALQAFNDPSETGAYTYPLHFAAQIGSRRDAEDSLRIVDLICSTRADAIWARDSKFRTALHMSVTGASSRITEWLIDKGVLRVDDEDNDGQSALLVARSVPNLRVLLNCGANIDYTDKAGFAAIHMAVLAGAEDRVLELVQRGATLDGFNNEIGTPLHCALAKKSKAALSILLSGHAPVNAINKDGDTPLLLAVKSGRNDLLQMLLDAGADPSIENNTGLTPIQAAIELNLATSIEKLLGHSQFLQDANFMPPLLHKCAARGHIASMKMLLGVAIIRKLYNINDRDASVRTLLHTAALHARVGIAKLLLDTGAAVDAQDRDGATPLLLACRNKKVITDHVSQTSEFPALLLSRGANHLIADKEGRTPWALACEFQDFPLMTCLVGRTADLLASRELCNPLNYAKALCPNPPDMKLIHKAIAAQEWDFVTICLGKGVLTSSVLLEGFGTFGEQAVAKLHSYAKRGDKAMIEWRLSKRQLFERPHSAEYNKWVSVTRRQFNTEWNEDII